MSDPVTAQDVVDERVLAPFLDGERIRQIPRKQAKRLALLSWLAAKFEPGVQYSEREVNEIIQRHHPDFAFFRRELVDWKFMVRGAGIYERVTMRSENAGR